MFSENRRSSREGAEAITRAASFSAPAIQSGTVDLRKTHTNEFVGED
jgi:hypothetical protein